MADTSYVYKVEIDDSNVDQTLADIDARLQALGQNVQRAAQQVERGVGKEIRQSASQSEKALNRAEQSARKFETQLIALIRTFPQQRAQIARLVQTHGSFNAVLNRTEGDVTDVERQFQQIIDSSPRLRAEINRLQGQFGNLNNVMVDINRQRFVRGSDVFGINPASVRQAGFAMERFGLRGAAAFGEIVAAVGPAGIALGGILATVNLLSRAFVEMARWAVDAFKTAVRESVDMARSLEVTRAQFVGFFDGDTRLAESALTRLRELSVQLGQDVTGIGRAFLPEVESMDQLERLIRIAVSLARTQPEQGIEGARIALQDLITGQTRSLVQRFEINRQVAREIENIIEFEGIEAGLIAFEEELQRTGRSVEDMADTFDVALGQIQQRIQRLGEAAGIPILEELSEQLGDVSEWAQENEADLRGLAEGFGDLVASVVEFIGLNINQALRDLDPATVEQLLEAFGELRDVAIEFIQSIIGENGSKLVEFLESLPDKVSEVAFRLDKIIEKMNALGMFLNAFTGGMERDLDAMIQGQIAAAKSTEDLLGVIERLASVSGEIDVIDVWGEDIRPNARRAILQRLLEEVETAEELAAAIDQINSRTRELGVGELAIAPDADVERINNFLQALQRIEQASTVDELREQWAGVSNELKGTDDLSVALFETYARELALVTDDVEEFQKLILSGASVFKPSSASTHELFGGFPPGSLDGPAIRQFFRDARRGAQEVAAGQEDLADAVGETTGAVDDQVDIFLQLEQAARQLAAAQDTLAEAQEKIAEEEAEFQRDIDKRLADITKEQNRDLEKLELDLSRKRIDIALKTAEKIEDAFIKQRQSVRDQAIELGRDLEDVELKHLRRQEDLQLKHIKKRIDLERDFQRKLEEIRRRADDAAFEAALQNDARELRRIRRQEQRDLRDAGIKRQEKEDDLTLDQAQEFEDLERRRQRDIEDANRANQRKLEDLQRSLQDRLEAIRLGEQREREELVLWEERKREDLEIKLQQRMEDYDEYVADRQYRLDKSLKDEYETVLAEQTKIAQLETEMIKLRLKQWRNFYGARGNFIGTGATGTPGAPGASGGGQGSGPPGPSIQELREAAIDAVNEALATRLIGQNQFENIVRQIPDMSTSALRLLIQQFGGVIPRQFGGPVTPDYHGRKGMPYLVGEAGAELFIPNEPGHILPNDVLRQLCYSPPPAMIGGGNSYDYSRRATVELPLRLGLSPSERAEVEIIAGNVARRVLG